jgi:hypothetical protein
MVQVIINDISVSNYEFVIDMTVIGAQPNPKDVSKDVMKLLTRIFSKLDFDYTKCKDLRVVDLGYYFADLAREKVFIARIPENTYILFHHPEDPIGEAVRLREDIVDLFVDTGSPLKHVYIVKMQRAVDEYHITISGLGYMHENIHILMNLIPREEDDGEIHIEVGHGMGKNKRVLLERVLKLSGHL